MSKERIEALSAAEHIAFKGMNELNQPKPADKAMFWFHRGIFVGITITDKAISDEVFPAWHPMNEFIDSYEAYLAWHNKSWPKQDLDVDTEIAKAFKSSVLNDDVKAWINANQEG
jgi:hypothetical protein